MIADNLPWEHIESTLEPLSADVYIIKGLSKTWIYDVGSNNDALEALSHINGDTNVIISHFHADHSFNLSKVKFNKVYVSQYSSKHIKDSLNDFCIVSDDVFIEDGDLKLHIFELPSSHCKGCLGLEINNEYAFIGDGAYAFRKEGNTLFNAGKLKEEIVKLKSLKADRLVLSHEKRAVYRKDTVIRNFERIYSMRKKNEPYINI